MSFYVEPYGTPGTPGTPPAAIMKSRLTPADVTITEAASFIETAQFTIAAGLYLVAPAWSWSTGADVFAAHGGLYDASDDLVLAQWNAFYNNGAQSGSLDRGPLPMRLLQRQTDISFFVSFASESVTGSLTDVSLDLYRLGAA